MQNVKIYTTPNCVYCRMAKEFFKEKGVNYEEFDVALDAQKRSEMVDLTGQMGVPVIGIGDTLIVGFNRSKVAELLGISE